MSFCTIIFTNQPINHPKIILVCTDSAHTGLNRTGIITYKFTNQERYSFPSLNIRKTRKSPSQISAPHLFFVFCDKQFHPFQVENAHFVGFCYFFKLLSFNLSPFGLNQLRSETVIHVRNWESKHAVRNWVPILVQPVNLKRAKLLPRFINR